MSEKAHVWAEDFEKADTFKGAIAAERARLCDLLDGEWPMASCPVCGVTVTVAMRSRHVAWHLRCLQ